MSYTNKSFSFSYSGATNDELEQIKKKYTQKEVNEKMKKVRSLDKNVDFISTMLSILFGISGTAFLVTGVTWLIKGFPSSAVSIMIGVLGIVIIAVMPFLHTKMYSLIKAHYAPEILALIKEIEQNNT